jgi:predicted ATPase with chaperone activity
VVVKVEGKLSAGFISFATEGPPDSIVKENKDRVKAAAGLPNLLIIGPPASGKTMLTRAVSTLIT